MRRFATAVLVLSLVACGENTDSASGSETLVAAAPVLTAVPEPTIVELRYPPTFPWGLEVDGYTLTRRYGAGEFREVCERNNGTFVVGSTGRARGDLICRHSGRQDPELRVTSLGQATPDHPSQCSWSFLRSYDAEDATDAVVNPHFQEVLALNRALEEAEIVGTYERSGAAHISFDGSDECWQAFNAGNFDCLRRGYAGVFLTTSIGTYRSAFEGETHRILQESIGGVNISMRHSDEGGAVMLGKNVTVASCER